MVTTLATFAEFGSEDNFRDGSADLGRGFELLASVVVLEFTALSEVGCFIDDFDGVGGRFEEVLLLFS